MHFKNISSVLRGFNSLLKNDLDKCIRYKLYLKTDAACVYLLPFKNLNNKHYIYYTLKILQYK